MKLAWSRSWSRRAAKNAAVSLVACSVMACGANPSPKPLSAEAALATPGGGAVSNTPVPTPAGVIAVGRARDYRQWVKLEQASPVVGLLKKKLIEEQGDALLEDWDLAQPVEFVVSYDADFRRTPQKAAPRPKPEAAAEGESEGEGEATAEEGEEAAAKPAVKNEDHFLAAFSVPLARYAPESYVKFGFTLWHGDVYERGKCVVAPALGSAKARLICADHPDVTHQLYEYMARGLPLEPLSSAPLFVELRAQPLKFLWAPARDGALQALRDWAENGGNTSRQVENLSRNVVKEFDTWVASADTLRFEGRPNERGEFEGSLTFSLRGPEPWLVDSFLAGAAKIHGAPSAFSNLPKDVGAAWYGYGMPAERTAVLQTALVDLAKTAFQEFGPISRGALKAEQAKAVDQLLPELISALDSPCIRAEETVFANIPADTSELKAYTGGKPIKLAKQPQKPPVVPFDVIARATLGQYLVAVPNEASCTPFAQHWIDMLSTSLKALPAKEKKKLPIGMTVRKNVKLTGLPPATVTRFTLTKQAVLDLMKELKSDSKLASEAKPADSALTRWGKPKGELALSVIVVPAADGAGSDWLGFGLDEKQLAQALVQATHPVPGQTLASRAELAPFIAQNPTSLSYQSFEAYSSLLALVGGPEFGPALSGLQGLFHGTTIVSTRNIKRRGNVVEANASYYLSKEGLTAVRQILSWDLERLLELADAVNQAAKASEADSKAK